MNNYKIALITAYIGPSENSELKITPECQKELDDYGIDIYRFNNSNIDLLKSYFIPVLDKEDVYYETKETKFRHWYNKNIRYRQKIYPTDEENYNRLIAKLPKMLFYKLVPETYDYYIWLDSKFTLYPHWLDYILWLINKYPKIDIITSAHSQRNNIREEFDLMKEQILKYKTKSFTAKYNISDISKQLNFYLKSPKFVDDKMFELGLIIYHSSILGKTELLDEWYAHNYYLTIQDQLSFPYLCQKHNIKIIGVVQDIVNMPFAKHDYGF